jgi:hypothetical protein
LRYCAVSWKTAQPAEEAHAELIKILRDLDKAREIICQMKYTGENAAEYINERVAEEAEDKYYEANTEF